MNEVVKYDIVNFLKKEIRAIFEINRYEKKLNECVPDSLRDVDYFKYRRQQAFLRIMERRKAIKEIKAITTTLV